MTEPDTQSTSTDGDDALDLQPSANPDDVAEADDKTWQDSDDVDVADDAAI